MVSEPPERSAYYWPQPGEDMKKAEAIAPKLTDLLRLEGDAAQKKGRPERGLARTHVGPHGLDLGEKGYTDVQAAIGIAGDIQVTFARDCAIEGCTLEHLAGYALELGRGCQRIRVAHNTITSIGAGGIRVGEGAVRADDFDKNNSHTITDNHIYDLGVVQTGGGDPGAPKRSKSHRPQSHSRPVLYRHFRGLELGLSGNTLSR